jgi:Ca-activated chloride channel family protein
MIMIVICLSASGPTWSRIPNPFFSETAPLAIVLNINQTMLTNDIQPTRLERAKIKIQDLLAIRSGARTALVAYAGSAHMVLPLTEDPDLLKPFLEGLAPEIMPVKGNDASIALDLAHNILTTDETPGSILFVTDDVSESVFPAFEKYNQLDERYGLVALIVGTRNGGNIRLEDGRLVGGPGIDKSRIKRWQQSGNVRIVDYDTGDADLRKINRIVASNLQASLDQDSRSEWLDQGWWLLWPILLLMLASFRRGWTMVW